MKRSSHIVFFLIAGALVLSGCTTMSMKIPEFDSIKLPEFREDAANIGDYQNWANAPLPPSDLRDPEVWDQNAKAIMRKRDNLVVPVSKERVKTNDEIVDEIKKLSAKVEEYKLDDPQ